MSEKPENPPAFPGNDGENANNPYFQTGMTLRDYFAATCPITMAEFVKGYKGPEDMSNSVLALEAFARLRGRYADAMLTERARRKP